MTPGHASQGGSRALTWDCEQRAGRLHVVLSGDIDENASLADLLPLLSGVVRLDVAGVRRINSAGVRDWVNFMREAAALAPRVILSQCSPAMVMQMNMIANFRGEAEVESIYAPYACPHCDREEDILVPLTAALRSTLPKGLPDFACQACGRILELDDIPERYFAFLKR